MIDAKDWPLEVEDHVVLDHPIDICNGGIAVLLVLAGTHGVVKHVDKYVTGIQVIVEFGAQLFSMNEPRMHLSLYRRSQHSRRRDEHDARRPKAKKT